MSEKTKRLGVSKIPDDPVALAHVLLKIYKHFDERKMTFSQLRIITAIMLRSVNDSGGCSTKDIAKETGFTKQKVEQEVISLVDSRHLHEIVPTFGDKYMYKLGAVGVTFALSVQRVWDTANEELSENV